MYWPGTIGRTSAFIDKNYNGDSNYPIIVNNNTIYAYNFFNCVDGNIANITFTGNEIYINRDIIAQSLGSEGYGAHVKKLNLYNNKIYRGSITTGTKYFNSINNITAINNEFYYAMSTYDIAFREECNWINNSVIPWPKYAKTANISSLSLPSSATNTAVLFRRVLPAAWVNGAYATGAYVTFNQQVYQALADVVLGDTDPSVNTTKWVLVDDPLLYIKGGSFDQYMARSGSLYWVNLNRVVIEDTLFTVRLISDWTSVYRPVSSGGTSNRFVFWFPTANVNATRDVTLNNVKFDFENRDNRHIFYSAAANAVNFTNFRIGTLPQYGTYPVNKMLYHVGGASTVITNFSTNSPEDVLEDTLFEAAITNKSFQNRVIKSYTADGTYVIPKGTLLQNLVIKSTTNIASFKIGTAAGIGDISDEALSAGINSVYTLNLYAETATTLYFTGITGSAGTTTITIFKK